MRSYYSLIPAFVVVLIASAPVLAQNLPVIPIGSDNTEGEKAKEDVGRTADIGIGQVGQRQSSSDAAPSISTTKRLNNRIQNRINNRIENRVDRDFQEFDGNSDAFERAGDQRRSTSQQAPDRY